MRRQVTLVFLLVFSVGCGSVSYDRLVNKKLREVLGPDQSRDYQWLTYPVTNFGILTAYNRIGTYVADVSDKHFICDTWNCIGVDPDTLPPAQQLSVANFAAVAEGPPISLTQSGRSSRSVRISAVDLFAAAPEVAAQLSRRRLLVSEVRCDRLYRRVLRRGVFTRAMASRPDTDELKQAFTSGRLVLVIGDVVIEGLRAKVTVESENSSDLDLAVTTKKLADAGFAVEQTGNTVFEIKAEKPVVAARLLARVPGDQKAAWEGPDDWSDWLSPRTLGRPIGSIAATRLIPTKP